MGSDQLGARGRGKDRAARAFESADAGVGVDADDKKIALGAGALEITHVADMKNVEAAVGKDDATAALTLVIEVTHGSSEGEDLLACGNHQRGGFAVGMVASPRNAASSSSRLAVEVPRFITTMPPA